MLFGGHLGMQYMGMPPMSYMPPQAFYHPMHYSPNPTHFSPNENKSVDISAHVYEDNEASIENNDVKYEPTVHQAELDEPVSIDLT
jgi:hypothetical protein